MAEPIATDIATSPAWSPAPGEVLVVRAKGFEASHAFADGEAARLHGHNYVLTAAVAGRVGGSHMLADARAVDAVLRDAVAPLDHRRLDVEYAPLRGRQSGTETLADALFDALASLVRDRLGAARLHRVRVAENDALWAERGDGGEVELVRVYGFSAAHRLADPDRGDEDNRRLYGKCANPQPHGHDYRVDVVVSGEPDRDTGLVTDLAGLDERVGRVLAAFDHRYLNVETPPFDRVVPTAERIAMRVYDLLATDVRGLSRVVVYETPRSAFAYAGPSRV